MQDRPVYVTPKGKADLEAKLEQLRTVDRPKLIERLGDVKSGSDWMENTEQILFEDDLAFLDRRIHDLEEMLADAELIEPDHDYNTVNIGDTVVIQDSDGELETYTIVGVAEADPTAGLISNESPMGRALLNHKVGEEVRVEAPAGESRFRIIAVK
jgi:transcription elongation factor GreA